MKVQLIFFKYFIFDKYFIINSLKWFPNGKKFLTGMSSGEILVINGNSF